MESEYNPGLDEAFRKFADSLSDIARTMRVNQAVSRVIKEEEKVHGYRSHPDGTGYSVHPLAPLAGWMYADAVHLAEIAASELPIDAELTGEDTWRHTLMISVFRALAQEPELNDHRLDHELTMIAATVIMWVKDRARRRDEEEPVSE